MAGFMQSYNVFHLNLGMMWFNLISVREKDHEYREIKPHWEKRIYGKHYDLICLKGGFPRKQDAHFIIYRPWKGFRERFGFTHEHFGPKPVDVFDIDVSGDSLTGEFTIKENNSMSLSCKVNIYVIDGCICERTSHGMERSQGRDRWFWQINTFEVGGYFLKEHVDYFNTFAGKHNIVTEFREGLRRGCI